MEWVLIQTKPIQLPTAQQQQQQQNRTYRKTEKQRAPPPCNPPFIADRSETLTASHLTAILREKVILQNTC